MRRAEIVFALLDQPLMEDQQAAFTRSLAFCEKGDGAAVLAEIAGLSRPASPLCAYAAWLTERVQNWPETGPAARPKAGFPQAGQP